MFFLQATCTLERGCGAGGTTGNMTQISEEDLADLRVAFDKIGQSVYESLNYLLKLKKIFMFEAKCDKVKGNIKINARLSYLPLCVVKFLNDIRNISVSLMSLYFHFQCSDCESALSTQSSYV